MIDLGPVKAEAFRLTCQADRPIVVLDATAGDQRGLVVTFVSQLQTLLAIDAQPQIYLLGASEPLRKNAELAGAVAARSGRLGVIGPTFRAIGATSAAPIALLAAGPIYDLDDWRGTEVLSRTTVVRFGDRPAGADLDEHAPEASQVVARLRSLIRGVELNLGRTLPVAWDNVSYRLDPKTGCLVADQAAGWDVSVLVSSPGSPPSANLRFDDGSRRSLPLARASDDWHLLPSDWRQLPDDEDAMVRALLEARDWPCPVCSHEHHDPSWDCPQPTDALMEQKAMPSLESVYGSGLVRFRRVDSGVYWQHLPVGSWPRAEAGWVARSGRALTVWQTTPTGLASVERNPYQLFETDPEDCHVAVL